MAYTYGQKLALAGIPWPVAKQMEVTVTKDKPQVAALTSESTAADVVTALKA